MAKDNRKIRHMAFWMTAKAAVLLLFSGCLLGPWDFTPEKAERHYTIWVDALLIAGEPVSNVCLEKTLAMDEAHTEAFAFYEQASLTIQGVFGGKDVVVALSADLFRPNCFHGPDSMLVTAGKAYTLEGIINWYNTNGLVSSRIGAVAEIPSEFSMQDSARTHILAQTMSSNSGTGQYKSGDTLLYLGGDLNMTMHHFYAAWSDDVRGILITQRFDSTAEQPQTIFDNMLGIESEKWTYYTPGRTRRLHIAETTGGRGEKRSAIGLAVINAWLFTGENTFIFYGANRDYFKYHQQTILQANNPSVEPFYNISGGKGIFAGAIKDSFTVNIITDPQTKSFPIQESRKAFCVEKGFDHNRDCRAFYRSHCQETDYRDDRCKMAVVLRSLELGAPWDSLAGHFGLLSGDFTQARQQAQRQYCIESNFDTKRDFCRDVKKLCHSLTGKNPCKKQLWHFCEDHYWRPEQCALALVAYCRDVDIRADVLCRQSERICGDLPEEPLCRD